MADGTTTTETGGTTAPAGYATTQNLYPSYYTDTLKNQAGMIQALQGSNGLINQTYSNWYSAPLTAGYDANSTAAYNAAGQTNPWAGWLGSQPTAGQAPQAGATYAPGTGQTTWNSQLPTTALGSAQAFLGSGAAAQGGLNQWSSGLNSVVADKGLYDQGNRNLQTAFSNTKIPEYNAATMQSQYLNPNVSAINSEVERLANERMKEQILPGINSTFTGAGQFGSTRNADFMNRALRDTTREVTGQQSRNLMDAYNQANQLYGQWADRGNQAAMQQGNLASAQANMGASLASTYGQYGNLATGQQNLNRSYLDYGNQLTGLADRGNQFDQQRLQNMMQTGQQYQNWDQAARDRTYKDWMTRQDYPLSALAKVGGMLGSIQTTPDKISPTQNIDNIEKMMALLKGFEGLDATTIGKGWDWLSGLLPGLFTARPGETGGNNEAVVP